jgi:hypothetical protein
MFNERPKNMAVGLSTTTTTNDTPNSNGSKSTKLKTIHKWFLDGKSLNRFEAEALHDHCLNTTVSTLQNVYGVKINRKRETVPCLGGMATVSVNRYWLDNKPENVTWAKNLFIRWDSPK